MLNLKKPSSDGDKIERLQWQLKIAMDALDRIAQGNLNLQVPEATDLDERERRFVESLRKTSDRLQAYQLSEKQRSWAADGISQFMACIHSHRDSKDFFDQVLTWIVRYCRCSQGGVFLFNDEDLDDPHLELTACYAYDKKKFIERRIGIGQGMLGQAFLEKETVVYTIVPERYFQITSGLGEATPRFLVIVPLRYNRDSVGVLELASFGRLEQHEIEFITRICENLAAMVVNNRHHVTATRLYAESQERARRLQEQEELLRQNIEELQATQEEMRRHERELHQRSEMQQFIIDNIPFPIFVKDEKGRYTMVNKSEAQLFNLPASSVLGKDDRAFVSNADEWSVIQRSDERVLASDEPVHLPVQNFTTPNGRTHVFRTTKVPFVNKETGRKNILGVSIDVTEQHVLESKLVRERRYNYSNTLINLAARQRMLSQRIGFCSEMIVRGLAEKTPMLRSSIDQFEASLHAIRDGGIAPGMEAASPLAPADARLFEYIAAVQKSWKPYKDAAQKIVYYHSFHDHKTIFARETELAASIVYIERHAEQLLEASDNLLLACLRLGEDNAEAA